MVVQAELVVGPADDPFEREADRVAAQVVEHLNQPAPLASVPADSDRIQASRNPIPASPAEE